MTQLKLAYIKVITTQAKERLKRLQTVTIKYLKMLLKCIFCYQV